MAVEIEDALIVITGAGSGIGRAAALEFAALGAHVIAVDIDGAAAERTAAECAERGPGGDAHVCDVADYEAVEGLAAEIESGHGPVSVLVNNAGVGVAGPWLETTIADWQWLRSINIDGVAHGCYAFGPAMLERGEGQVVNIASAAAYLPQRYMAAYCASKAAVVSLSQCLRADWRDHGVGVSVICPGVIATPIARNSRYRGPMEARAERAQWGLSKGHSPEIVGRAIVDCVRRNRDVVPVGFESTVAYKLLRGAPQPIQGLLARARI